MNSQRSDYFEIWSRSETGEARLHGRASGLTFEDACKQLACDSLDFWRYYQRGSYGGQKLYTSAGEALAGE